MDSKQNSSQINLTGSVTTLSEAIEDKDLSLDKDVKEKEKVKKGRKYIVEPTMMFYQASMAIMSPLASQYVLSNMYERFNVTSINGSSVCGDVDTTSDAYIRQQEAQAASARFIVGYQLLQGIPSLFVTLLLGAYSDQRGRRLVLMLPLIGMVIRQLIVVVQIVFKLPLETTYIGSFLEGLTGSNAILMSTCYSYISDTVPAKDRSKRILVAEFLSTFLQAFFQISLGYLIQGLGFLYPYVILAVIYSCNLLYVIFFVPESKPPSKMPLKMSGVMKGSFKAVFRKRTIPVPRYLLLINIAVLVFLVLGHGNIVTIESLYLLNSPHCMDSVSLGQWKFIRVLFQALGMIICGKFVLRRFGDITVIIMSCCFCIAYCIVFGLSTETWMVYAVLVLSTGVRVSIPVTKSMLTKSVSKEELGGLMSLVQCTTKATNLVGNVMYNNLYAATLLFFKGTTFFVFAFVMSISVALTVTYKCLLRKNNAATRIETIGIEITRF